MTDKLYRWPTQFDLINRVRPFVHWTIKERQDGLWVPVADFHNIVTDFGLTGLASAPSGQYTPPTFLVIETSKTTMSSASVGGGSVVTAADPTISGDTQLVLSVGLAAQETVTFSSKSGSGPFTFTLSGTLVNNHANLDPVVRATTALDTMTSVLVEAQYDPTFNPGNRSAMTAAFSPATGQNTMQFFLSGSTATNVYFAHVGLTDQVSISSIAANLHNYAVLGYNHNGTNDIEVDVNYTLQRF
jgi:hypothetical protein